MERLSFMPKATFPTVVPEVQRFMLFRNNLRLRHTTTNYATCKFRIASLSILALVDSREETVQFNAAYVCVWVP